MAVLKTVYDSATGRPVYEGFGPDPSESTDGRGTIETILPPLEESGAVPQCGTEKVWIIGGERVLRDDYPLARLHTEGFTATLEPGHIFGEIHAQAGEADSYTFDPPGIETALALDAALNPDGLVQLVPFQWYPQADPPEIKGELPQGWILVEPDLLRGLLPAGALSLAELGEEG